jgi:hypothetical protein
MASETGVPVEEAMLTKVLRVSFTIVVVTLLLWVSNALADTVSGSWRGSCVHSRGLLNCVDKWHKTYDDSRPRQRTEREIAESAERDRRWVARCRPVIRQDRYGVDRYEYAAPGCEYGKTDD